MGHSCMEYRVKYRGIKYPRLEFKTGKLELILPFNESPKDIIEKHKHWIMQKQEFINECLKRAKSKKLVKRDDKQFKTLVNTFVSQISKKLRVKLNKIFYRKMRTKWASCSTKKNLTINTLMKYLPKELIEYIIYHELTHIKEKRHNERFWKIMSKRFKNYQSLETSLFSYWFLVISLEEKKMLPKKNK